MSIRREDFRTGFSPGPMFHASSVSVGAHIVRAGQQAVNDYYAGPAVALPTVGGASAGRAERQDGRVERYLRHGAATAKVEGLIDRNGIATVAAQASVRKFTVFNPPTTFTANYVEVSTLSKRKLGVAGARNQYTETTVRYREAGDESQDAPIVIDGGPGGRIEITPVVDLELSKVRTLEALDAKFAEDKFFKAYRHRFLSAGRRHRETGCRGSMDSGCDARL